ncbi:MAG: S9 family peptidase [Acidobacteria bacterium]|nr:S9 family peptidase [Acidobacteriota bacterium]
MRKASPLRFVPILFLVIARIGLAQQEIAAPNENLVVEDIPPIPTSLVEGVARYSDFRSASLASWSPTQLEMLISTRFADVPQIHAVKIPGGARTQLTFYPDAVIQASFDPRQANYFVFSKDIGGGEFYQLYGYDISTGDVTLLTDGKSRNVGMVWMHGGGTIAYGSTRRDGNDVDIWVMNPADRKSDHMLARLEGGGWRALDWSGDGTRLLVMNEISAEESYLWLLDSNSGAKTLLTPKSTAKVHYGAAAFSKDGKGVYVTTDKDSEFHRLGYLELASKESTYLTSNIPWDIDEFDLSEDGRLLAFVANEDGFGVLHVLDTQTRNQRSLPALPKGVISGVLWHRDSRNLGFNLSSARSSSDVYSLNIASGKVERWTFSETGGLNTSNFAEPELIHWKSWDGRSISGFLYRPPTKFSGRHPVIINIHGGPEAQFRPTFLARSDYYLNELGIAMIFPNVRGSNGYGKTFLSLDNGSLREGSYKDIASLLDWIQTQPELDPNRVMVTGGSYGGFMTLEVATNYNDRICCSVDVVGPSNLVTFLQHTSGYRQDLRRAEYGDERDPKTRDFLERIAPYNHAKQITKPLFVIAGQNDPRVPASESQQMVEIVRQNGTPVWWLLAKDEGHGFRKKKNADYQFYATVLFVKKYLLKANEK